MQQYIQETEFFDFNTAGIQALVAEFIDQPTKQQIEGLFLTIRDNWRYNPYTISGKKDHYKASDVVGRKEGHCIDKSVLFIAALRALKIPARLRLAKVVNHIAAERLTEKLGNPHIAPHGIAEVYVDGKWFKASNAFNKELCEIYNVDPLYFNGTEDAMIQPFNRSAQKYMEYIEDYGHFDDVPFRFIIDTFQQNYPALAHAFVEDRFTI
jgi:transglutaminase-like putative cysteine protease